MKLKIVFWILLLCLTLGSSIPAHSNNALVEHVSSLVYNAKADGFATADDGVKWILYSDGPENDYDSIRGIHFGSNIDLEKVRRISVKTNQFHKDYLISKIVVNASCGSEESNKSANIAIQVGEEIFVQKGFISNLACDYTFNINKTITDNNTLIVQVRYKDEKKPCPLYLKSIKVYYKAPPCAEINLVDSIMAIRLKDGEFDIKSLISQNNYTDTLEYSVVSDLDVATISPEGIVTPKKEGMAKVKILAPAIIDTFAKTERIVTLFVDGEESMNYSKKVRYDFTNPSLWGYSGKTKYIIRTGNSFSKGMTRITLTNYPTKSTQLLNTTSAKYLALNYKGVFTIDVPQGYLIKNVNVTTTGDIDKYHLYDSDFSGNGSRDGLLLQSLDLTALSATACFKSIEIEYMPCQLNDAADNNTFVGNLDGATTNVFLNRSLSNEYWNTFCVPFDISEAQVNSVMGSVEIKEYSSLVGTDMLFSAVQSIEAGKPYLIKPQKSIDGMHFVNVTFTKNVPIEVKYSNSNGSFSFVGTYGLTDLDTDGTELFITKSGGLNKPKSGGNKLKGMRAFIRLSSVSQYSAAKLVLGGTTSIIQPEVDCFDKEDHSVFDIMGHKVGQGSLNDLKPQKGVYIIDGRKVVFK